MNNDPLTNPLTLETPETPYLYLQNTLTCTEGKGFDGSGSVL